MDDKEPEMNEDRVAQPGDPGVRYPLEEERAADERLDPEQARAFLGLDIQTFEEEALARDGLPRDKAGFAYHDLVALALDRRLPRSVPALGLRMMMRFADQSREALVAPVRWEFRFSLGVQETAGDGEIVLRDPTTARMDLHGNYARSYADDGWVIPRESGVAVEGAMETVGVDACIDSPVASSLYDELIAAFRSDVIRFQWIGSVGRRAWERTWKSGRADCVVLARTTHRMLGERGLVARMQWGRILGMLDARHVWTEVLEDGEWKRFDPLLQLNFERLWGQHDKRGGLLPRERR